MISISDVKSGVVGAGILLSAFTLSSISAEAQEPSGPVREAGVSAPLDDQASLLNSASRVERLSGPLQGLKLPAYDGPIQWDRQPTGNERAWFPVLGGLVGATVVAGIVAKAEENRYDRSNSAFFGGAALGCVLGAGLGFAGMPPAANVVRFSTTVEVVESLMPAHMETHRSGKSRVTDGPYFGEIIKIPETDMLLAVNNFKAPLVPGQKINAEFFVDPNNQILCWHAAPGAR